MNSTVDYAHVWGQILENTEAINNIVTAICTIVATIVAILTYRKAKSTIFQSEVAKHQTTLIMDILNLFMLNSNMPFMHQIYDNIVMCNIYEHSKEYGIPLVPLADDEQEQTEIVKEMEELRAGYEILDMSNIKPFDNLFQPELNFLRTVEKNQKLDFHFDVVFLTKDFFNLLKALKNYISNPFLPKALKEPLECLVADIEHNITNPMARVLERNLQILLDENENREFWHQAVFNEFLHQSDRIDHTPLINSLIEKMRNYLKIE